MFQNETGDIWGRQAFFGLCDDFTQLFERKHRNMTHKSKNCWFSFSTEKNYLHNLWIHYKFWMNFPLCLQVPSCSTLWLRLTPPLSPDIHFIVIFPYSSNITSVDSGKDNSYWEGKLGYEHYEKRLPGHEVLLSYQGFAGRKKWLAVTLSLFKGLQMKFSSLFSPLFSTFKLFT